MRLHREIFAICSTFLTGLFLLSPSLLAQEFIAPEQITKFGRTYKLAYTKIVPNGQAIYEYTANNESI